MRMLSNYAVLSLQCKQSTQIFHSLAKEPVYDLRSLSLIVKSTL